MADVLIIDDDADVAAAMAALLRQRGHSVRHAADAGAGLSLLREHVPDLVLLDLGLPRVDGLSLLDALHDDPQFEDLRVAVFSGQTDDASVHSAERFGACDFIPKGSPWPVVSERIEALLAAGTAPA